MTAPLYNSTILKLAAATARLGRLPPPCSTAERRSPLCGSRVTIDLKVDADGRISAMGGVVRACALGQAATAVLADAITGRTAADIESAAQSLADFLAGTAETPGDWPGLEIFAPARPHVARHPSIRLAFETAAEAARRAHDNPSA